MSRRRSVSPFQLLFLPLIALFLLAVILLGAIVLNIPRQAAATFGPPAAGLTTEQRYWLSALLLAQSGDLIQPVNPGGPEVAFEIAPGESVPSITGRLLEAGLIANPGVFRSYLQYSGLDTSLQAGEYTLSAGMSPIQIAQAMQSAIAGEVTFTILAGWRVEEIAAALPTSGLNISADEFLGAVQIRPQGYTFSDELPGNSVEGFLFPGIYTLPRETTLQQLIPALLSRFDENVSSELRAGFAEQGLTLYQAVTLAAIVEREAIIDDEMPMIASVFFNRLAAGARLDSDPTVQYALGYNEAQNTWWTNLLSLADLAFDSPYNTYIYTGLPPGPICNPGPAALRAVAFPAQTPYYYFRAACDGSGRHAFAVTFDEHLQNECP
jgi:UPF0755 protein